MFRADLHIHSRFSRATSKKLTLRNIAAFACIKGIRLVGTGDITHPKWLDEISDELFYNEETGFYQLKNPLTSQDILEQTGIHIKEVHFQPEFILQGEINCIYEKHGKTRKNHQIIFVPTIDEAKKINAKLEKIGNLAADGRPVLKLDAKILLEIILSAAPNSDLQNYLIPAHIWTPWYSVFGSKSGFNSLEECFEDLTKELFALETGLSSDPAMNRLWSALDSFTLISNSDAHSGENLGREVNIFSSALTYQSLFDALKRKNDLFCGTVEFYPEEGKYYADGHRNCNICFLPEESRKHNAICPFCGKPLTIGVLNRVEELSDRDKPPAGEYRFESCIPLKEILSEIFHVGAKSKQIHALYEKFINLLGAELDILQNVPIEQITEINAPLAKAIQSMRTKNVQKICGYDGEYGKIKILDS